MVVYLGSSSQISDCSGWAVAWIVACALAPGEAETAADLLQRSRWEDVAGRGTQERWRRASRWNHEGKEARETYCSVSVATGGSFCCQRPAQLRPLCGLRLLFWWRSCESTAGLIQTAIEAADTEAHSTPFPLPPANPTLTPPRSPFINQPVGSQATPDTWHTILAGRPDIVGGGQVWSPAQNYNGSSHAHGWLANTRPLVDSNPQHICSFPPSACTLGDDEMHIFFSSHASNMKPRSPDVTDVKEKPAFFRGCDGSLYAGYWNLVISAVCVPLCLKE